MMNDERRSDLSITFELETMGMEMALTLISRKMEQNPDEEMSVILPPIKLFVKLGTAERTTQW